MDTFQQAWNYQNRMMDAKPSDYVGDQASWEMNVLNWVLRQINNDTIDLELLYNLTTILERSKQN